MPKDNVVCTTQANGPSLDDYSFPRSRLARDGDVPTILGVQRQSRLERDDTANVEDDYPWARLGREGLAEAAFAVVFKAGDMDNFASATTAGKSPIETMSHQQTLVRMVHEVGSSLPMSFSAREC